MADDANDLRSPAQKAADTKKRMAKASIGGCQLSEQEVEDLVTALDAAIEVVEFMERGQRFFEIITRLKHIREVIDK